MRSSSVGSSGSAPGGGGSGDSDGPEYSPGTRSGKLMTLSRQKTENRTTVATTGKVRGRETGGGGGGEMLGKSEGYQGTPWSTALIALPMETLSALSVALEINPERIEIEAEARTLCQALISLGLK